MRHVRLIVTVITLVAVEGDAGTFVLAIVWSRGGPWLIVADMDRSHRR